jgi:hypothetical protein
VGNRLGKHANRAGSPECNAESSRKLGLSTALFEIEPPRAAVKAPRVKAKPPAENHLPLAFKLS